MAGVGFALCSARRENMSIGFVIRRLLGSSEAVVADAYRGAFVSLSDLVRQIGEFRPQPARILEVGCGEGAMATLLSRSYPESHITAIDISPAIGRLYAGSRENISFRQQSLQQFMADSPDARFDLVVMADVLHHVRADRPRLLSDIRHVLSEGGGFVLKDLDRSMHPVFLLAHFADYAITGDRHVKYHSASELSDMLATAFGPDAVSLPAYVKPWRSNVVFFVSKN